MTAPTLAWGEAHLFQLPDGDHIYGREFELLPAGTMFAAGSILHGIAGMAASVGHDNIARVAADAMPEVFAIRETCSDELGLYHDEVIEGFRLTQQQAAQG